MHLFLRYSLPAMAAIAMISSCQASPSSAPPAIMKEAGATLVVKPSLSRRIAEVGLFSRASVDHVVVSVLRQDGTSETLAAQAEVAAADLDHELRFDDLRYHTTYRLRARAYAASGALISDDAASTLTVAVGDSAPTLATLTVKLVDREYPTVSTSSLDATTYDFESSIMVGAYDADDNRYWADTNSHCIRMTAPDGTVTTLAGGEGVAGYEDGAGPWARFDGPTGLARDRVGNMFVADKNNHRIRKIAPDGTVTTVAGGQSGYEDGSGYWARFSMPGGVVLDALERIFVYDTGNQRVRVIQ